MDRNGAVVRERRADAALEVLDAEQPVYGQRADRDDQRRADQPQLPFPPEGAEPLFFALGLAVAAFRVLAGVAARDRSAVEGRVELVLVEPEPAPECLARAAAPGSALLAFDHAGRLSEHVGALAGVGLDDRERLDGESRLGTSAADPVVALERGDRAIVRPASRQERTATNQRPARTVSPPPSSAASRSGSK